MLKFIEYDIQMSQWFMSLSLDFQEQFRFTSFRQLVCLLNMTKYKWLENTNIAEC